MPTARVNGLTLYYEHHGGSGQALVFVHGYTGDISDWRHQINEFSRTHRVLVVEQRGHGRSEAPPDCSAYTIPQMARDLQALIERIGFQRYHLVGHSMGGAVVQEVTLGSPDKLLSLTLEDTYHWFNLGPYPEMAEWTDRRCHVAERWGMAAVAELESSLPLLPPMSAERLEQEKEGLARMSVDVFLGAWEGLTTWEGTEERAHKITAPTLVIVGDLDSRLFVEGCLKLARLIPNATVEVIPEAGHSPQWERPELFNAALRRFLEQHGTTP